MKKKVFSLMMTLLLAFVGVAKADVVTIGEGTSTTYVTPFNSLWGYSFVEQIYTADEIGTAGTINAISFNMSSTTEQTNSVDVFMVNVTRSTFSSNTDYEPVTAADMVFSGTVTFSPGWTTITLDTPFEYDGTSNLLIGMHEYTSGYSTRYFYYTSASNMALSYHSDSANPDPYNLGSYSGSKYTSANRANIQIDITPGGGGGGQVGDRLHVRYMAGEEEIIDSLNMGVRPIGAWMEPFNFTMYTDGPIYTVTFLDFTPTDGLFTVTGEELPFHVTRTHDVELTLGTNATQPGLIERQFVAITEGNRAAHIWPVVVEVYSPECPDVWELACQEATSFPFVEVPATAHNTVLHNDYTLPFPEIPEGYDAVYKLVFDNDQVLNAEVTAGANGKVALYTEDFYGEGGPMADNNYTGIQLGGPVASYPYEVQLGEGTSTSGYLPFYCFYNYSLSQQLYLATELTEAGVSGAPMTSLSWYCTATNNNLQSNITIWIANVEQTAVTAASPLTSTMTKVYEGNMTPIVGWNEFVFNQGSFAWDGNSSILVCVQRNNGAWASGVNWQVGTQSFTAGAYKYSDTEGPYDMTTNSYSMTTTTSRANVIMKGGNREGGNRDVVVNFEDQQIPADWDNTSAYPWVVVNDNGSYVMKSSNGGVASSTSTISATYDFTSGGTISFDALCMGEGTSTIWDKCIFAIDGEQQFSYGANVSGWNNYSYNVNPGSHTFTWTYSKDSSVNPTGDYFMVDNVTITGMGEPLPEPEINYSCGPVIENLPLRGGTYYLVASSTDPNFEVTINAEDMPCPEVEGFAFNPSPADDADGIEPNRVTLRWNIPTNATGWRLIFGSTYHPEPGHPQTIMFPEDGSFSPALANSYTVRNLLNNTNYFWRVEFTNDNCPEGVSGPVWGFTTHLNVPQNLTVVDNTVFTDEQIVLNWTPVVDRTYRMYNVYRDGELIGSTQVNNIGNSTYTDGPLAYNIDGYTYYVTAVYDEGESGPSNTVNVKVSGYGDVDGHVYEQDGETGIAGATVTMVGHDEFNVSHTYNFTTNAQGYYSGHIYAGSYNGSAAKDGYQTIYEPIQGNPIDLVYNQTTSPIDYKLDENFDPVCTVIAQYYPDSTDINAPYVKVFWGCGLPGEEIVEPFETGDFSLFDWQIDPTYPWSITTNNPYEGTYCMKSGGAGVANVISNMSVTVNIPADGIMSFFGKISCESSWDYGYFYIDGVQKGNYTGAGTWSEKTFDITAGDHTFMWQYTKDGSVNSNDDCFYVDYITFYRRPEPAIPGMTYDFEDSSMQGWTSIDADGDGYGWYVASEIMSTGYGHNGSNDCVLSQSYNNNVGILYPDNYLVSPQVQLGGVLRFYACAQDASYAAEHFGVAVSTTNTQPSSFTMLQEWTMSAKSMGEGKPVTRNTRSGRAQGNWYEYTVDLSAYSGMGYVAIRHFNCSDMFYLDVDDITIGEPGKGMPNNNRAFAYYRIYRTDCYNDGPYTEENTALLASEVTDTVYIDTYWPDVAPGVYKWGVGCVYIGNRGELIEGPISWAEPMAVNRDMNAEATDQAPVAVNVNRAPWDLMASFTGTSAGQQAIATDGNYIYTASWQTTPTGGYTFYQYDMSGNFIEGFNIAGATGIRDLTCDGQYFYGSSGAASVFKLDLASRTLVGTINCSGATSRHCTYDPVRNGLWVGNWSTLALYDMTGNLVFTAPAPSSAYGSAYFVDDSGDEHLYLFCQPSSDAKVFDYNITTNTLGTTAIFDFASTPGFSSGIAGGCFIDDYNGKVAFFGNVQQDPNLIGIYELKNSSNPGPTPGLGGNNPIQEPRESEIVWSNCLDKDMYLNHVSVQVLLNSADSPEGTTVDFTNLNEFEQQNYPVDQLVLDGTGYYAFDSFRRGDYLVQVRHEGYEPIDDTVSIWENTDLRYVMIEILYGVGNVYVSRTGWAMWDGQSLNPTPGTGTGSTFSVNFDDSQIPAGWTTIDANNDGYNWVLGSNVGGIYLISGATLAGTGHNSSADMICSGSYSNYTSQAITPDNYLVSPQVTLASGSTFSFWACAQDASYAAEHFGVFVSDNGTSDWTAVQEWTMTAKSGGDVMSIGRDGNNRAQGNWHQYTVDLSAFAGQKYIAIRHFNCNDQFILNVDDIELTAGAKDGDRHFEYYKVLCTSIDGVPIYNHNTVHPFCQLTTDGPYNAPLVEGEHYLCKVAAVYSTGSSEWSTPVEWEYEPCEHWGPVDDVTVGATSQGNHIEWVFEHGFNPYGGDTPGPIPGDASTFSENLDSGIPAGWTTIDADGDGYTWVSSMNPGNYHNSGVNLEGTGHNSSAHYVISGSWINQPGQALTPDNYFVSPQVTLVAGSTFSFWACAQDASYPADHFGVFISDNGTSNWTMVNEWTMTAKGGGVMSTGRNGETRAQGNWYNYSVDLSAFAGQKYIAIRHFNCTDQFILNVDDIELTAGAKGGHDFVKGGEFYTQYAEDGIMLNFFAIDNVDLRAFLLYNLSKDNRFSLVPDTQYGQFILNSNVASNNFMNEFETVYQNVIADFSMLTKNDILSQMNEWKTGINPQYYLSINMDVALSNSRSDNDHCALSMPFCTSDYIEFEAASTEQTAEQLEGQSFEDGCIGNSYNPSWYHMRIHTAGQFVIHMEGHDPIDPSTERDVDFCIWGPFTDPISPCVSQLTIDKIIDCSYSASYSEDIYLGYPEDQHDHGYANHGTVNYHVPEVGEYYIVMLTNYSRQPCVITFTKTEGVGETDCEIVNPTVDLIGFLITEDGEYVAFAGPDDREYTVEGEFGDHDYCVRPIYPGEMILPDHNYGWSMGCPVCEFGPSGQGITCDAGAPIHAEELHATDQVKIWWGDQPTPPGASGWMTYGMDDPESVTIVGAGQGVPMSWAMMIPAEQLGEYVGSSLTKVRVYQVDESGFGGTQHGEVTASVCLGGTTAPGAAVTTKVFNMPSTEYGWIDVTLDNSVLLDGTQNVWVVFHSDCTTCSHPASAVDDIANTVNNRWAELGGQWADLGDFGLTGKMWLIQAYADGGAKNSDRQIVLNGDQSAVAPAYNGNISLNATESVAVPTHRSEIVKYNVYRSNDNAAYTMIGEVAAVAGQTYYEYIDTPATTGTYYYQVRADYGDCESDPAQAADDPNHNYVTASVDAIGENGGEVALFPNPTTGNVTIQANGMRRITVVSVLGQVVYDTELNADETILNMGQFNAGMYMVRVYTESGVTVKRVTVMQ